MPQSSSGYERCHCGGLRIILPIWMSLKFHLHQHATATARIETVSFMSAPKYLTHQAPMACNKKTVNKHVLRAPDLQQKHKHLYNTICILHKKNIYIYAQSWKVQTCASPVLPIRPYICMRLVMLANSLMAESHVSIQMQTKCVTGTDAVKKKFAL